MFPAFVCIPTKIFIAYRFILCARIVGELTEQLQGYL